MNYVIPVLLLFTFVLALIKKVPLFDSFTEGMKEAIKLIFELLPYLATVFLAVELMRESGVSKYLAVVINPVFSLLGLPNELIELLILRPLSGSGSLVVLQNIYTEYGADSYVGRVASVIMGATDTVLYITAVYFATLKNKKTGLAIPISLIASLIGAVAAAWLCKVI